jgi:cyanate permease
MGPREALRTRAFYLMLLAQTALALVISGLHFHWFAYMTGQGLSDEVAVASISISSLAGIPVSLFAGLLAERVQLRYIFLATYLGFSASVLILIYTTTPLMAYAYGISLGIVSGVTFTINQVYGRTTTDAGPSAPYGALRRHSTRSRTRWDHLWRRWCLTPRVATA